MTHIMIMRVMIILLAAVNPSAMTFTMSNALVISGDDAASGNGAHPSARCRIFDTSKEKLVKKKFQLRGY